MFIALIVRGQFCRGELILQGSIEPCRPLRNLVRSRFGNHPKTASESDQRIQANIVSMVDTTALKTMSKRKSEIFASRFAVVALLLLAGESVMSLEQPRYTVLHKSGDIEYRQYESYLVAETMVAGTVDYKEAGTEGFRRLFRYISGANRGQSKIEMTAPVTRAPAGEEIAMTAPVQRVESADGWRVTFMLPTGYTIETAPIPTDDRVRIRQVPPRLMAVMRYSGRWTEKVLTAKTDELKEAVDADNVGRIGSFESAAYDPPYMPPFFRRNEVMVEVDRVPASVDQVPVSIERAAEEQSTGS
jgi:hypothetical protein